VELAEALAKAQEQPGTLVTLFDDGRPQVSVVFAAVVDGHLWVSVTQDRVKTRNVRRDPRVVISFGTMPWFAIEGRATLREGPDVLEDLRRYYRTARGEHDNWEAYDAAMIADQRLIMEIEPLRAYP
jgi:PPOX class probable F420-dependent enzyme